MACEEGLAPGRLRGVYCCLGVFFSEYLSECILSRYCLWLYYDHGDLLVTGLFVGWSCDGHEIRDRVGPRLCFEILVPTVHAMHHTTKSSWSKGCTSAACHVKDIRFVVKSDQLGDKGNPSNSQSRLVPHLNVSIFGTIQRSSPASSTYVRMSWKGFRDRDTAWLVTPPLC